MLWSSKKSTLNPPHFQHLKNNIIQHPTPSKNHQKVRIPIIRKPNKPIILPSLLIPINLPTIHHIRQSPKNIQLAFFHPRKKRRAEKKNRARNSHKPTHNQQPQNNRMTLMKLRLIPIRINKSSHKAATISNHQLQSRRSSPLIMTRRIIRIPY